MNKVGRREEGFKDRSTYIITQNKSQFSFMM